MELLKPGDSAPDFELNTHRGQPLRLSSLRGKRVILYFYPEDDTPGCTKQACGFRDAYTTIEERNAVVIGISPDSAESHQRFRNKYNLPFALLVDTDHTVANLYGVWGEKSFMGRKSMGVIRSHFIIDEHGVLADVQVNIKADASVQRALASIAA